MMQSHPPDRKQDTQASKSEAKRVASAEGGRGEGGACGFYEGKEIQDGDPLGCLLHPLLCEEQKHWGINTPALDIRGFRLRRFPVRPFLIEFCFDIFRAL